MPNFRILADNKRLVLNVAGYLRELFSNYDPSHKFQFSVSLDKKRKIIKLNFKKVERRAKNEYFNKGFQKRKV